MSIFINSDSKVLVQGMTGSEGRKHTQRMLTSGTQIVGGVTPGKGGQSVEFTGADGSPVQVPVFSSVGEAREATGADVTVIFVPAKFTKGAVVEAIEAETPSSSSSPRVSRCTTRRSSTRSRPPRARRG